MKNYPTNIAGYSKAIASLVGALIGLGISFGLLPEEARDPEIISAITVLMTVLITVISPANKPAG